MGRVKGHIPIRTCISCGAKRPKHELIRISMDTAGRLKKDFSGKMPGRGAYVCQRRSCQHQLSRHKGLNKVFRTNKHLTVLFLGG